jgi:2-dehydro-3-deoxygluconokinase
VRANGGKVAFDSNYRARLWSSPAEAAAARDAAASCSDIGLPTLSDEAELGGGDERETTARWKALGCREVAVKLGSGGCLVADALQPPPQPVSVLDSSGAGDAFNAGYLAARLAGHDPAAAALEGQRLAAWTLSRRGAIPPRDETAPYRLSVTGSPE